MNEAPEYRCLQMVLGNFQVASRSWIGWNSEGHCMSRDGTEGALVNMFVLSIHRRRNA